MTIQEEVRALLAPVTPWPWVADDATHTVRTPSDALVADGMGYLDAALIARAPELLATLCDDLDAAEFNLDGHRRLLADAEADVTRLTQWKAEAMQVMSGLQELGQTLGLRWGVRITGDHAAEVARDLRERAEKAEAAIERVRAEVLGEDDEEWVRTSGKSRMIAGRFILEALDGES